MLKNQWFFNGFVGMDKGGKGGHGLQGRSVATAAEGSGAVKFD